MAIEDENNYGLSGAQVKEMVAQTKKRAVSVGEDGSSHVEEADQLYTKTLQLQDASFAFRTTAGDLSIETGSADLLAIKGHTIQEGHVNEVKTFSYEFADSETTATIDWDKYDNPTDPNFVGMDGTYSFSFLGSSGQVCRVRNPNNDTVVLTPENLERYLGVTINGAFAAGDTMVVDYTRLVVGTLTTATPTSFVATGYNQYDATVGYAHVIGGNQYRIAGTYTSIGIADEPGGTTTTLEVTNGKFTPEADGYVYVSGASGDILIALVWSGTRDSDPYEAFSKTTITIPTIDKESNSLPTTTYGMPSVGDVADELNFADKLYIQRIGHYAYSAENLETVEALGVDYWYDEEDIFYVLETPIKYKLADSVRGEYTANDYGTEEFVGTSVSVDAMFTYGNNLVDKLRNLLDIQSIGDKLELNGSQLNVAQSALSDLGGARVLTEPNYPVDNPTKIAHWPLDDGVYVTSLEVMPDNGSSALSIPIFMKSTDGNVSRIYYPANDGVGLNLFYWRFWEANKSTGARGRFGRMFPPIVNDLVTNSADKTLSAAQGKVLKDLIDALDTRVTALEGN